MDGGILDVVLWLLAVDTVLQQTDEHRTTTIYWHNFSCENPNILKYRHWMNVVHACTDIRSPNYTNVIKYELCEECSECLGVREQIHGLWGSKWCRYTEDVSIWLCIGCVCCALLWMNLQGPVVYFVLVGDAADVTRMHVTWVIQLGIVADRTPHNMTQLRKTWVRPSLLRECVQTTCYHFGRSWHVGHQPPAQKQVKMQMH